MTTINQNASSFIMCSIDDLRKVVSECLQQIMFEQNDTQTSNEEYLTTEEATKILHCNRSTLYRWHEEGFLPKTKVGRNNLYEKKAILNILQRNEK